MMPKNWPARTSSDTSLMAWIPPNDFETLLILSTVGPQCVEVATEPGFTSPVADKEIFFPRKAS